VWAHDFRDFFKVASHFIYQRLHTLKQAQTVITRAILNLFQCFISHVNHRRWLHVKLDGVCWFSQRHSPTPHFRRAHALRTQGGATTPTFELGRYFCPVHLPPSFIILCLLVQKLSCWETNKHTSKQTPLKTCWVIKHWHSFKIISATLYVLENIRALQ